MANEQASHRDLVALTPNGVWTVVDPHIAPPSLAAEAGAWRQIDLGLRFPVHSIEIAQPAVADTPEVRIAFSDDGETWASPEIVPRADDAAATAPILIAPAETSWTRYIRVSTTALAADDAGNPRVWTERAAFDLIVWRNLMNADFDLVSERPGIDLYRGYRLLGHPEQRSLSIVGIDLYENGAFGNFIIQCLLAIGICVALKLKYIKLPARDRSEVLNYAEPREIGGITFIPASHSLPTDGYFLSGMFFDVQIQKLAGDLEQERSRHIITNYIRPLFNRLPTRFPTKPDDQLLIHIRSGDIFSTWVAPHYPQPPLAFYKLVIERLIAEKGIASIKLVFENRLNPVISELEAYIVGLGIPLETQSGTLADDVAALVNGRYLVFGLGTFGPGVCHLSERVEEVYYFASGWPQHFRGIPTIGKIVEVVDRAGAYTKVGEWDNSPERRQMMIDYPIEQLAFDDRM
ncbi:MULTISPECIES: coagulation factor 5 8 type domain-containing protein [unclassified Methylobacterium]|uniref:coagulation factor 5 8 type domain-containing protein n=1 Tax=unclassified Methylobacterium TaxID=2615210 RepID=UPI00089F5485|nr:MULTISPECIES: coagulation factor 5 8 type domain-containing protein [unclassified Methylobacterium]MBN4094651.1 coagulation factor 5 8 type domain-containing protein [Methylobacterium sp. OT2]SEG31353.1 hypothetical protein SAMN04488144_113143 [Methylobacterium sp. 190mf]